jgi:hypothetical protein
MREEEGENDEKTNSAVESIGFGGRNCTGDRSGGDRWCFQRNERGILGPFEAGRKRGYPGDK